MAPQQKGTNRESEGSHSEGRNGVDTQSITPLLKIPILCLCSISFFESLAGSVIYPFLVFMVSAYGHSGVYLGVYAGVLAATFCGAQSFSSMMWGRLSDRYGLVPCIMVGVLGSAVCMILLGISTTYTQAVLARAFAGLLNGNIGLVKAFVGKSTDDSNRAIGFSYVSIASGCGLCLGPTIGGLLCSPANTWPPLFSGSIFDKYPILLPCSIVGTWGTFAFLVILFFLKEPGQNVTRDISLDSKYEKLSPLHKLPPPGVSPEAEKTDNEHLDAQVEELLKLPFSVKSGHVAISCVAYGMYCLVQQMIDESLPLFMKASANVGGLGFDEVHIGAALAFGGIATTSMSLCVTPRLERRIGAVNLYKVGVAGSIPLFAGFWLVGLFWSHIPRWLGWVIISSVILLKNVAMSLAFTATSIMICNSVSSEHLGSVNGVAQTLGAVARTVGPAICGMLWSLGAVLNFIPLTFLVIGAACLACAYISMALPVSLRYSYTSTYASSISSSDEKSTTQKPAEIIFRVEV
jgi:MFS family permease